MKKKRTSAASEPNETQAGAKKPRDKKLVSITTRLFRSIAIILVLAVATLIFVDSRMLNFVNLLQSGVRLWIASTRVELAYKTPAAFSSELDDIKDTYALNYVEIYNSSDALVYSSSFSGGSQSLPPFDDASDLGEKYHKNFEITKSSEPNASRYFMICSLPTSADVEFLTLVTKLASGDTLYLYMQKNQIDMTTKVSVGFLSALSILLIVITLLIVSKYVRHFVRPLQQISDVTGKMANMDFSEKCPPSNMLEIDKLSQSVNDMSDSLSLALDDLKANNKKLQDDIEQERTMEHIRQTFISGVSHELKTPIAIIQGYAEGAEMFMDKDPAMAKQYAHTINDEAVRMNQMVMKLLEITKYDSGEYRIARENFNIRKLCCDWIDRNSAVLADKGINASCTVDASLEGSGDQMILSSVINNYMSNAMSHVAGDMRIEISAAPLEGRTRVYVFNTGSHIADKDIDKIWNSFYRADKAMSRSQGRFGLGLAIVASIQKLHGMDYGVENVDGGVRFWFDIALPADGGKQDKDKAD